MHKHDPLAAKDKFAVLQSMLTAAMALAEDIPVRDRKARAELIDVLAIANICVLRLNEARP